MGFFMATDNFRILDKVLSFLRTAKFRPYLNKSCTVLDIGCGNGKLLKSIEGLIESGDGYDIGIEYKKLSNKISLYDLDYDYKALNNSTKEYSIITLAAVLEHVAIDKVDELLEALKNRLNPCGGGGILLTTPTLMAKPIIEFLGYKLKLLSEEQVRDHKKYYSRKDFDDLAKRHGLKVCKYKTFWCGLNSFVVLNKD
jgi:2-polyprenyl-3-methyl-5-hydroxy-6-metoxy-1,4-benzoquinol methylase